MRARFVSRILAGRWAPCAALLGGSLAFVVLAVALIPEHLGPASVASDASSEVRSRQLSSPVRRSPPPPIAELAPPAPPPAYASTLTPPPAPVVKIAEPTAAVATIEPTVADQPPRESWSERHARRRALATGHLIDETQPPITAPTPAVDSAAPALGDTPPTE